MATGRRLQKTPLQAMAGGLANAAFSPDGSIIAFTSWYSNSISLLKVSTGKQLKILEAHTDDVGSLVFSPDGRILVSDSMDNNIRIWDVQTGHCLRTLIGAGSIANFSPDGQIIAASNVYKKGIDFWEVSTGSHLKTFKKVDGYPTFSTDSSLFAVSNSNDYTIGIWEVATGKHLQTLKGHTAPLNMLAFSPAGLLLASSSQDGTLGIWDVKTGKRVRTLKGGISSEGIIAFSPDSRTLAFTTDDNAIGLWDLEDNINEWSGISLDEKGEYKIDLNTLPYKLDGLELKPDKEKADSPDKPARWSKYHPFHWLPQAEAGDSNAMLQIGTIYDRNNDLARALQWYQRAIKAGSPQAKEQQDRLLHWLEDKDNWQTVPGPFRDAFCTARAEFELLEKVRGLCGTK
ncbi:MAG: WD40-like Beta Propeller Repeat [Candidatus Electronema aureum]|uniref:WD40-like Beta Propeller Repeat n=1 Tax=Candidatus Electronema aureum TaxID=2005002 RepID=A0A521FY57_9BACT|nr:MAG: WD40-like Beta Propeller Repeat [Candidatus Electronema aureum]